MMRCKFCHLEVEPDDKGDLRTKRYPPSYGCYRNPANQSPAAVAPHELEPEVDPHVALARWRKAAPMALACVALELPADEVRLFGRDQRGKIELLSRQPTSSQDTWDIVVDLLVQHESALAREHV